jgi:hypothetical protein
MVDTSGAGVFLPSWYVDGMTDTIPIANLLVGFLGGSVLGAGITAWRTRAEQTRARRADYLSRQLHELYGPIHFLCGQNVKIFEYGKQIDHGYNVEFAAPEKSKQLSGSEHGHQQAMDTIETQNDYGRIATKNNRQIVDVMLENYALIELDDAAPFQEFAMHVLRHKTEFPDGKWRLPVAMFEHVGPVHTYTPELPDLVARRFAEKSNELAKLRGL